MGGVDSRYRKNYNNKCIGRKIIYKYNKIKIKDVISDVFYHSNVLYKEKRAGHSKDKRRVDILLKAKESVWELKKKRKRKKNKRERKRGRRGKRSKDSKQEREEAR